MWDGKPWRERVVEARERGEFTALDELMASQWPTCAVGEQHAVLPEVIVYTKGLGGVGAPVDRLLRMAGSIDGFYGAVMYNNFGLAEYWLAMIEDRVLELKRGAA